MVFYSSFLRDGGDVVVVVVRLLIARYRAGLHGDAVANLVDQEAREVEHVMLTV